MAREWTYSEIAERLGISRTLVEIIEKRALAKLAMAMGDKGAWQRLPAWIRAAGRGSKLRVIRCSRCQGVGHNVRTCRESPRESPREAPAALGTKVDVDSVQA